MVVSTPGVKPYSGWPGVLRVQLAEVLQLLHRQVVAGQVQQRVEQHRAVAVGQHEAVAVGPVRVGRVVAQVALPQRHGDLGHAHRHARVAGVGLLHGVHRERADGVGEFGVGRLGSDGRFHRKRANYTQRMIELPFRSAARDFEQLVLAATRPARRTGSSSAATELLVELGPLERARATTCGCKARPAWARAAVAKNHDWLGSDAAEPYI